MGEPEQPAMHNYAYHPSVANWVHSTSLAQLDGLSDEPPEDSPDDFYKAALPPQKHFGPSPFDDVHDDNDMTTTTRQRQQSSNGAVRSTPKPAAARSVSGPAASLPSTRPTPTLPANRPTVKSLAQKFNQPSSNESSPTSSRVRPRPSPSSRSTAGASSPAASSSPAHATKGASYGTYKFNNLKPRERPQPAPASPASVRRANGVRKSVDEHAVPPRKNIASPTRSQTQAGTATARQPFFGEVIGDQDVSIPGFGIPSVEVPSHGSGPVGSAPSDTSTIKFVQDDSNIKPEPLFSRNPSTRHYQTPIELPRTSAEPVSDLRERRYSPPSRIPVASRRMSIASDSSSSTRSYQAGSTQTRGIHKMSSPTRTHRPAVGRSPAAHKPGAPTHITLPSTTYRDYRERGKSPKSTPNGPSLAAVITPTPQPTSPRLRHANERHLLPQESPTISQPTEMAGLPEPLVQQPEARTPSGQPMIRMVEQDDVPSLSDNATTRQSSIPETTDSHRTSIAAEVDTDQHLPEHDKAVAITHQEPLTLRTSTLGTMPTLEPLSSTTDFEYEESPVLGMPGSFMMTPPMPPPAQQTPPMKALEEPDQTPKAKEEPNPVGELLQARAFVPPGKERSFAPPSEETSQVAPSELTTRESIPIMLGSDGARPDWGISNEGPRHSPRLSIGAHRWRAEPLDSSGTIAFLEEDDSPTDPFANRHTLGPDDSASVAFYQQIERQIPDWAPPPIPAIHDAGRLTLDSKAYSVINEVLNLYHRTDQITPEVAYTSKKKIQKASPIVAQHKDWGSKEATETYLARLLSDAAISGDQPDRSPSTDAVAEPSEAAKDKPIPQAPVLGVPGLDDELAESHGPGTAIIFPPESRRYSRGSRGSTTTTIYDDTSRAGSFSGNATRDSFADDSSARLHKNRSTYGPHPPPKDWQRSPSPGPSQSAAASARGSTERLGGPFSSILPELEFVGEGLGLSLRVGRQQALQSIGYAPPRPPYSPPPIPGQSFNHAGLQPPNATPYSPSVYHPHPPSSVLPQGPIPDNNNNNMGPVLSAVYSRLAGESQDEPPSPTTNDEGTGGKGKGAVRSDDPTATADGPQEVMPETNAEGVAIGITVEGDDPMMARLKRRYRVMEELAMTEHTFLCDMMVAHRMWAASFTVISTDEKEKRTLFCNVEELSKISFAFWDDIREAVGWVFNQELPPQADEVRDPPYNEFLHLNDRRDRRTTVGAVFLKYMTQLERVFNTYLLNHEDASALIKSKAKDPAYIGWQLACYNESKGLTNAWDLDSLLVKPVQRLLKYPLLLEELEKVTPQDHPDYENISASRKEMIAISTRINQNKRRKETLRAAAQEGKKEKNKVGFRGMGFVKALTNKTADRVKPQASATASIEGYVDKEYEKFAQKFGGHFFQLQIVLKDLDKYHEEMTNCFLHLNIVALGFIQVLESAPPTHTELASAWRQKTMALLELRNVLLEDHKKAIRQRIFKPLLELWNLQVRPQKLMEQRKKLLPQYVKYKAAMDRNEKVDSKLEETANSFLAVNDALKVELPKMYELTQRCVRACLDILIMFQKDWWKNCQKKLLPLLDYEPEHTTSFHHDMQCYVDRYNSDAQSINSAMSHLAICNGALVNDMANFMSPVPNWSADDNSSRKSSSRRTESISSELSTAEPRSRRSGGYGQRNNVPSFEGPPRSAPHDRTYPPTIAGPAFPRASRDRGERLLRDDRTSVDKASAERATRHYYPSMDGTNEDERHQPAPAMASAYLSPESSKPNSVRGSGVFNSALPMSDAEREVAAAESMPGTPADVDEPEVLFLAASLFEFNIAHDRREGGIPYLVYVPGEIFDVIGMKGELWLARNQDDPSKTVGWIWEKHFARILPEEI